MLSTIISECALVSVISVSSDLATWMCFVFSDLFMSLRPLDTTPKFQNTVSALYQPFQLHLHFLRDSSEGPTPAPLRLSPFTGATETVYCVNVPASLEALTVMMYLFPGSS